MVIRTGISLDPKLFKKFDGFIKKKGYTNRSEAIQDILREFLFCKKEGGIFATVKVVYDHRLGHYNNKITELQHKYHCIVLSSNRTYLDHHSCLEVILVKGKLDRIENLVKQLKNLGGVKKVEFSKEK